MYLTSKTAGGKRYFYIAQYVGKTKYSNKRYEYVYSLGNTENAMQLLTLWSLDKKFFPNELSILDVSIDDVIRWKNKVFEKIKQVA